MNIALQRVCQGSFVLLLAGALAGCGTLAPRPTAATGVTPVALRTPTALPSPTAIPAPIPTLAGNPAPITTASGLQYIDIVEGTQGEPAEEGNLVEVYYVGYLEDGTIFDSLPVEKVGLDPYLVTLGEHQVIAGWEEGLLGMRGGGKRRLIIPPELAYGAQGYAGLIPPNATLVFDVDVPYVHPGNN